MKSEVVLDFTPLEPLGPAISDFTPSGVSSKICKGCHQELPLSSFGNHQFNRDGLNGKCKACLNQQSRERKAANPEQYRAVKKRWLDKNPDWLRNYQKNYQSADKWVKYRRDYARTKQAAAVAARPALRPCHCGNTDPKRFRWQKGQWICWDCVRASNRPARLARERAKSRIAGIARKSADLLSRFGEKVQGGYLRFIELHPKLPANVPVEKFIQFALPGDYQNLRSCSVERILLLNKVSRQHITNIGWNCAHCEARAVDHRFFDLDHAIARSLGGKNSFRNLQILCPNCHRLKTISDRLALDMRQHELGGTAGNAPAPLSSNNNTPKPGADPGMCGEAQPLESAQITAQDSAGKNLER